MIKKSIILALYRILANGGKLIAWNFPPRNYKKAFIALKSFLKENNVPIDKTASDWPHFSVAYIPPPNEEQVKKIKLDSPSFSSRIRTKHLSIFEGRKTPYTYIVWELEVSNAKKFKEYVEFIDELMGTKNADSGHTPHVSLAVCDKKYTEQLKEMEPALNDLIKPFSVVYLPEHLQFWGDFRIEDIENL